MSRFIKRGETIWNIPMLSMNPYDWLLQFLTFLNLEMSNIIDTDWKIIGIQIVLSLMIVNGDLKHIWLAYLMQISEL